MESLRELVCAASGSESSSSMAAFDHFWFCIMFIMLHGPASRFGIHQVRAGKLLVL
jgi:hypothetical protein